MKITKYTLVIALLGIAGKSAAQMSSRIDQFFLDPSVLNPAAMSMQKSASASLFFNRIYSAVQGTPQNVLANVVLPLPNERTTFGIYYLNENAGFSSLQNAYVSYAYAIPFKDESKLSLGVSLGFMNQSFDPSKAVYIHSNDPVINSLIFSPAVTRADLRASAFYTRNGFKFGVSTSRLPKPRFDYSYFNYAAEYNLQNVSNILLGHSFEVGEKVKIEPMANVTLWDFKNYRAQLNINASYDNKFWFGFSGNDASQFGANMGANLGGGTRFGYAFMYPTGKSREVLGNGHEFFFTIGLGRGSVAPAADETTQDEKATSERRKVQITVTDLPGFIEAGLGIDTAGITIAKLDSNAKAAPGFYIVTGVSSDESKANKMIKNLYMNDQFSYKYFDRKNNSYYVYVKYFKTRNEADRFLLSSEVGLTQSWVREVK
ncbi:MAG: PorP/SprF family type IX secretion system membrane protein [Sphingomonadales bacterium]